MLRYGALYQGLERCVTGGAQYSLGGCWTGGFSAAFACQTHATELVILDEFNRIQFGVNIVNDV